MKMINMPTNQQIYNKVINFNAKNVKYMSGIVEECECLKNLDLSNFDTSNTIKTNNMFYKSGQLKELNLSNFNTNNVIDMAGMFYD